MLLLFAPEPKEGNKNLQSILLKQILSQNCNMIPLPLSLLPAALYSLVFVLENYPSRHTSRKLHIPVLSINQSHVSSSPLSASLSLSLSLCTAMPVFVLAVVHLALRVEGFVLSHLFSFWYLMAER